MKRTLSLIFVIAAISPDIQAGTVWSKDSNGDGKPELVMEMINNNEELIKEDKDQDGKFETLTQRKYHRDLLAEEIILEDRDKDGKYEWRIEKTYLYSKSVIIESHYYDKEDDGRIESEDHKSSPLLPLKKTAF